jgi:hypothetical protein
MLQWKLLIALNRLAVTEDVMNRFDGKLQELSNGRGDHAGIG